MKCFTHRSVDSIGLCKSCGRGLCPDCLVEIGSACACLNRCEEDVEKLNEMIERGSKIYQKTSGVYVRSGFFTLLMGAVFLVCGFLFGSDGGLNYFTLSLGVLFMLYGLSQFFTARKYREK